MKKTLIIFALITCFLLSAVACTNKTDGNLTTETVSDTTMVRVTETVQETEEETSPNPNFTYEGANTDSGFGQINP